MKIIDNFLPKYYFEMIQEMLVSDFPWYYGDILEYPTDKEKDMFHFYHCLYERDNPSVFFDLVKPCIPLLGARNLLRVKANLQTRTWFNRNGGYHTDPWPDATTAVYYVNTNNGWTHIKGHGKVKSVANRVVIFDSNLKHAGFTCTDEKRRVVVNFNYA